MNFATPGPETLALGAVGCLLAGYVIFHILLAMLPGKSRSANINRKKEVLRKAMRQREKVFKDARVRHKQHMQLKLEEWESNLEERKADLKATGEGLDAQEVSVGELENHISLLQKDLDRARNRLHNAKQKYQVVSERGETMLKDLQKNLEAKAELDSGDLRQRLQQEIIEKRQLETQRRGKETVEQLQIHSGKKADRMLARCLSRYAPEFPWPKAVNHVEFKTPDLAEKLEQDNNRLITTLQELTEGVEITVTADRDQLPLGLKLAGGYGIYKEAARLTLEKILHKGPNEWDRVAHIYDQEKATLENTAFKLGKQAVLDLKIEGLHEEILRMVGALNWRTSYRQNQYLHTVEVARLAGIIASEFGMNEDEAKRCGLLHDIGKGIDYRIEGSHAVISGDYADRYGESQLICETVMSHHNDLVLETPLSYVLKTADTLSGARPGARVNLEEGYQIRLSAIDQVVRSFKGVQKISIMNGGREVHIDVNHKVVRENDLESLAGRIARKIEEDVAFPGQIKVIATRRFESSAVA